jgi:quercetin dioxygenase-like cupin family protein
VGRTLVANRLLAGSACGKRRRGRPLNSVVSHHFREVPVELIRAGEATVLSNSGVTSHQLLFPENSRSERVTVTRVSVVPGAKNPPHRHASSEQIWIALRGKGQLILDNGQVVPFHVGDLVRFEDNDLHGFENTGEGEFEYLSVTSPPVNFRGAYAKDWK